MSHETADDDARQTTDDTTDEPKGLFELAQVITVTGLLQQRLRQARSSLADLRSRLKVAQETDEDDGTEESSEAPGLTEDAQASNDTDDTTGDVEEPTNDATEEDEKETPPSRGDVARAEEAVEHLAALDQQGEMLRRRRSLFLAAEAAAHLPRKSPSSPGVHLVRRLQDNLTVVLQHGHSLHRVRALRALRHIASADCLPTLEGTLRDNSPWVQATALRTFLSLDLEEADSRRALRRFLWRAFFASYQTDNPQGASFFHLLGGIVAGAKRQRGGRSLILLAWILGLVRGTCRLLAWAGWAALYLSAFFLFIGLLIVVFALGESLWDWFSGVFGGFWTDLGNTISTSVDGAGTAVSCLLLALLVLSPLGQLKLPITKGIRAWGPTLATALPGLVLDGYLIALAWLLKEQLHLWAMIVFGSFHLLEVFANDEDGDADFQTPRWLGRGVLLASLAFYQGCSGIYGWWILAATLHIVPIWWVYGPESWQTWKKAGRSLLILLGLGGILALMPMLGDLLLWTILGGLAYGVLRWTSHLGHSQVPWLRTYLLARNPRHFASREDFIAYVLGVARNEGLSAASRSRGVRQLMQLPLADPQVVARLMELASEANLPSAVRDATFQVVDTIEQRIQQGQNTPLSDALELPEAPRLPSTAPMLRHPMRWLLGVTLLTLSAVTFYVLWSGHLNADISSSWIPFVLAWTAVPALLLCTATVGHVSAWRRATWIWSFGTLVSVLARRLQVWPLETQTAGTWPSLCAETPFLVDWPTLSSLLVGAALFFLGGLLGEVIHRLEGEGAESPPAPLRKVGWTVLVLLCGSTLVLQSVPLETYLELRRHGPKPEVTAASEDGNRWWLELRVQEPRAVRVAVLDLPAGIALPSRLETYPWYYQSSWETANAAKNEAERAVRNLAASWYVFTPDGVEPLLDEGCGTSSVAATSAIQLNLEACPEVSGHRHLAVTLFGQHRSRFLLDPDGISGYRIPVGPHRHFGSLSTVTDHLTWIPLDVPPRASDTLCNLKCHQNIELPRIFAPALYSHLHRSSRPF